jgi:hypothetical protein
MFYWRKLYHFVKPEPSPHFVSSPDVRLHPVTLAGEAAHEAHDDAVPAGCGTGTMDIEFSGRALVSVQGNADADIVRAVSESLRR